MSEAIVKAGIPAPATNPLSEYVITTKTSLENAATEGWRQGYEAGYLAGAQAGAEAAWTAGVRAGAQAAGDANYVQGVNAGMAAQKAASEASEELQADRERQRIEAIKVAVRRWDRERPDWWREPVELPALPKKAG